MNSKVKKLLITHILMSCLLGAVGIALSYAISQSDIEKNIIGTWISEYKFPGIHGFHIRSFSPDKTCKTKKALYFSNNRKIFETEERYSIDDDKISYTITKSDYPDLMPIGTKSYETIIAASPIDMWYLDQSRARYIYKKINPIQAQLVWATRLAATSNEQEKIQKRFYPSTSKLYSETHFDDRGREILYKEYYMSGKLKLERQVTGENAITRAYYENGVLDSEGQSKNNQPIGVQKSYYENGKLFMEKTIKDNAVYSDKMYDKDGMLISEDLQNERKSYDEGMLSVHTIRASNKRGLTRKYFYENGTVKSIAEYPESEKDGIEMNYYRNGQKSAEVIYKDKNIIEVKIYDKSGKIIFNKSPEDSKKEEVAYKAGRKNGILTKHGNKGCLMDVTYDNGLISREILYNENGDVLIDDDYKNGRSKIYRDDGSLRSESINKNAKLLNPETMLKEPVRKITGDVIQYYRNGTVKEVRVFHEGTLMHLKKFDDHGKLLLEQDAKDGPINIFQ